MKKPIVTKQAKPVKQPVAANAAPVQQPQQQISLTLEQLFQVEASMCKNLTELEHLIYNAFNRFNSVNAEGKILSIVLLFVDLFAKSSSVNAAEILSIFAKYADQTKARYEAELNKQKETDKKPKQKEAEKKETTTEKK